MSVFIIIVFNKKGFSVSVLKMRKYRIETTLQQTAPLKSVNVKLEAKSSYFGSP